MVSKKNRKIAVIGLGYVGLPLATALAHHYSVTGFDINQKRIEQLKEGYDLTHEIDLSILKSSSIHFTSQTEDIANHQIYIITVPTPINEHNEPDLHCLRKASETIGKCLTPGTIVVYESTVYPGVTEEFCGPILEKISQLKAGQDFFLGYSPERINPGDKLHTLDKITKVVSGQNTETVNILREIYGSINNNNIFVARNIKTAEAAKVIENTQRDINIAFMNEITTIMNQLGLSIYDVLDAANTKWNFLNFQPGLVGGHCIGVDPYYLAHCATQLDVEPRVILSGRQINEEMGTKISEQIYKRLLSLNLRPNLSKILVLGLTFKENIPDLRNTKVTHIIDALAAFGYSLDVHDPHAESMEAKSLVGDKWLDSLLDIEAYDCVICAVPHLIYQKFTQEDLSRLIKKPGLIVDIKRIWKPLDSESVEYMTL